MSFRIRGLEARQFDQDAANASRRRSMKPGRDSPPCRGHRREAIGGCSGVRLPPAEYRNKGAEARRGLSHTLPHALSV